jgi:hypothetical protein
LTAQVEVGVDGEKMGVKVAAALVAGLVGRLGAGRDMVGVIRALLNSKTL